MPSTAVRPELARDGDCAASAAAAARLHASERALRFMALQYRIVDASQVDRITAEVDRAVDEIVQFTADLVRIPTVNPPGDEYEACARFLGDQLARHRFDVEYVVADASET